MNKTIAMINLTITVPIPITGMMKTTMRTPDDTGMRTGTTENMHPWMKKDAGNMVQEADRRAEA
jgi:hypothetical protein